jgi:ring-1,2-phenylacetyl-CoA epoxidase subunit PaaC
MGDGGGEPGGTDGHWAFGTGFADPLSGVDTSLPAGVDGAELAGYCLMLGDDALIASHRLQELCTRAPELEDEVALANIALDLLGQARLLLTRAGAADGSGRGEDDYAFGRPAAGFRQVGLVAAAGGDFAFQVVRLLVFATWRLAVLRRLTGSRDPVLAAIAAKGVLEVTYHRDYAARWTVRLGDGTARSHARAVAAVDAVWPMLAELFVAHPVEARLAVAGVAADPSEVRAECLATLATVLTEATLPVPDAGSAPGPPPGRDGAHPPGFDTLVAELQSVARAHPGAHW